MEIAILIALVAVLAVLVFLAVRVVGDAPGRAELARLRAREQDYHGIASQLKERASENERLKIERARLAAQMDAEKRAAREKLGLLQDAEVRLKQEFENLAHRIFEHRGRTFDEQNRERISGLLQPFKEQLEFFRKRVDEVHSKETEQSAMLLEKVRQLQEASNKVSDEANHLARAIKGDAKRQGDWGELIVERIFEASGLEPGREYDAQTGLRADDGVLRKPDFLVYLPGDKVVIVDSKVSLTAYDRFCAAEENVPGNKALAEHVQSVRQHVQDLRDKNYGALLGNRTLDFVLMCIPLEPAYQAVLQADEDLIYDLAKSHVVVTGPTTLMITLKLIAQIWRREHENRNAEVIADQAGRMYDQVALIVEAMTDAHKKLGQVSEAFDLAVKRLQSGRGNLIGRVEKIRRLGARVSKRLPPGIQLEPDSDEEVETPQDLPEPNRLPNLP